MTPRHITTSHAVVACAICGRNLLRGERPDVFVGEGAEHLVCELCVPRAMQGGWRRADEVSGGPRTERSSNRQSLLERLRSRRGAAEQPVDGEIEPPLAPEPWFADDPAPLEEGEPAAAAPAAPPAPPAPLVGAIDAFNASEHPRTVAGVARSLGEPVVSARPLAGDAVRITVGWELSWYRYEVQLEDSEKEPVRLAERGYELGDLDPRDLVPNAVADERGELLLVGSAG